MYLVHTFDSYAERLHCVATILNQYNIQHPFLMQNLLHICHATHSVAVRYNLKHHDESIFSDTKKYRSTSISLGKTVKWKSKQQIVSHYYRDIFSITFRTFPFEILANDL